MGTYILALDQGTTSSRAIVFDRRGDIVSKAQFPFRQLYPQPGWVEHDPMEIWETERRAAAQAAAGLEGEVAGIGVTNQRETTVVWDRVTGEPIHNAIVWQCRRTTEIVERCCSDAETAAEVTHRTGLIPDAYYSASKIAWILDAVPGARERAEAGELAFGTVDSWLIWNLTQGEVHATDPTNASRTMLFNINTGQWDEWLCRLFNVPEAMLPEVRPSSGDFGMMHHPVIAGAIPIRGVAGDQQAALFGQCCFKPGQVKATFGTGCFLLMSTGQRLCASTHGLVTTVAASAPGAADLEYALEGSVFMAGALIQWLRDGLGIIDDVSQTEELAMSVPDSAGVCVVPAFTGLGAPYWDANARGAIYGLTRGATKAHIVRACLEAQAFQVQDVLQGMARDAGIPVSALAVDGGACRNNFMLQCCADIVGAAIQRPECVESTALGAAYLAGLSTGFWRNTEEIASLRGIERTFMSNVSAGTRSRMLDYWHECVDRTRSR